jgi:hypothetical protein
VSLSKHAKKLQKFSGRPIELCRVACTAAKLLKGDMPHAIGYIHAHEANGDDVPSRSADPKLRIRWNMRYAQVYGGMLANKALQLVQAAREHERRLAQQQTIIDVEKAETRSDMLWGAP